jgi:hypothetical protein
VEQGAESTILGQPLQGFAARAEELVRPTQYTNATTAVLVEILTVDPAQNEEYDGVL